MQLVMLAAGRGTRFGGLKQIAPVGPRGEALMDFTVRAAERAGFDEVVIVVRRESAEEVLSHVARAWPAGVRVEAAEQPEDPPGTVPAVLSARALLRGPFGIVNADDCYDTSVLAQLRAELAAMEEAGPSSPNVIVSFSLIRTILTAEPVKRGLCVTAPDGSLADLVEHHVRLRTDGRFDAWPLDGSPPGARVLLGHEPVSMNLWGLQPRLLAELEQAVERWVAGEVLLPDVLGGLARDGRERIRVRHSEARCLGLTHREDLAPLREQLPSLGVLDGLLP